MQKYNLSEPTKEEQEAFMKDFRELLEKHSMYYEPVPQYSRKEIGAPWEVTCQILLQKKELSVDEVIPSPFKDESTETTT